MNISRFHDTSMLLLLQTAQDIPIRLDMAMYVGIAIAFSAQ